MLLHPSEVVNLLGEWQAENDVSDQRLSLALGCGRDVIQNWRTGKTLPSLVFAFKLERVTRGGVPAVYWISTPLGVAASTSQERNRARRWAKHRSRQENIRLHRVVAGKAGYARSKAVGGRDEADASASPPTAPNDGEVNS